MSYYETELVDCAAALYFRRIEREGRAHWDQPNRYASGQVGNTITLASGHRVLAKYRVDVRGYLHCKRFTP